MDVREVVEDRRQDFGHQPAIEGFGDDEHIVDDECRVSAGVDDDASAPLYSSTANWSDTAVVVVVLSRPNDRHLAPSYR